MNAEPKIKLYPQSNGQPMLYQYFPRPFPWWKTWIWRIFGRKHVGVDVSDGITTTCIGYQLFGHFLITEITTR
jgi:hypothetical protein